MRNSKWLWSVPSLAVMQYFSQVSCVFYQRIYTKTSPSSVNASSIGNCSREIFLISRSNDSMKPQYKNSNNRTHTCLEPMEVDRVAYRPLDSCSPGMGSVYVNTSNILGARVRIKISCAFMGSPNQQWDHSVCFLHLASFRRRSSNHKNSYPAHRSHRRDQHQRLRIQAFQTQSDDTRKT